MIALELGTRVPIYAWTEGVPIEQEAQAQLRNVANLPVVGPHVAVMPDVHWGIGATVGSVISTQRAIIPAAVGVDLGCGMIARETGLHADDCIPKKGALLDAISRAIPHGGPGVKGSWEQSGYGAPKRVYKVWGDEFNDEFVALQAKYPRIKEKPTWAQLGTLGGGNHFIEVCADTDGRVWLMLHSGSRGVGNRIGTHFIETAKRQALRLDRNVKVDANLAWLDEGTEAFEDYVKAVLWAQRYAARNRDLMMDRLISTVWEVMGTPVFFAHQMLAVNCHHNYVEPRANGQYITRKGAVSARTGELGIIPGSMGAKSFIVRGKGNPESFESCSHGAGRAMSRSRARREISLARHRESLTDVACINDERTIDEAVDAYKSIDAVMAAQTDLVEVVAELKQFVCVKG